MAEPRRRLRKVAWGLVGFWLFVLALELLKAGAKPLAPAIVDAVRVHDAVDALGFGWILAELVLSGSPVAVLAITFLSQQAIDAYQAFAMIAGSRLGAAFVVLLLGYVYFLRGGREPGSHGSATSLELGVLSLLVTFAVYVPALPVGFALLASGFLNDLELQPVALLNVLDAVTAPVTRPLEAFLHPALLLLGGLGLLILAFRLFDRALPDLSGLRARASVQRVFRPSVAFAIGFVVTALTLSVSVSLGLLVPLAARGYVRRENVIPYIMGANVSTFIDTLVAAILVGGPPEGLTPAAVVLAEMLSVAVLSLGIIVLAYRPFERVLLAATRFVVGSRATLTLFVLGVLAAPILILVLR